jgi:hypothetical protein
MPTKFRAEDPEDRSRSICGYVYPGECRGGHPILLGDAYAAVTSRAAEGVPFTRIAEETGLSLDIVRRVVHR